MKFTLSWLKEHLDTDAPLETILDTLNRIGLEVESVQDPAKTLGGFTIAHVIEAKQHPNADRLRVCTVDTGAGAPLQVVCGAPNARTGMKSVFSPPGTFIPGKNITIGKGVIRGVESAGMLCSAAELQLSEDHDGIIDLPENAPVGARYIDWAGLGDPVIEINLTPNRADAAGVHGIARDLAAAGIGKLRKDGVAQVPGAGECPVRVTLDFAEADRHLCPAFALRLVRGVKNGPSPDWLQRRLKAIGLRPINALVDMTNFLTFDRGRPLHVFDAAKVKGHLTVKKAEGGEVLEGLNGKTYTLEAGMVAIFDAEGVESLGGIMGGTATGCDETTTDVLIESALWDPADIARTGRKLGIVTDARYRFERGVDANFNLPGLELATRMVLDLCGGSASAVHLAGEIPETERIVDFPLSETRRLTGLELPLPEVKAILTGLGFWVSGNGPVVKVAVPSWRGDIEGKADIVEEITRIAGLDRVPAQPIQRIETVHPPVLTLLQQRMRRGRRALAARGLMEAVTWSFVSEADARLFGTPDNRIAELKLANPIAAELSDMRPSLMPGLLRAAQRNADRGYGDVALFELGQVFESDGETGQRIAASGVRRGLATPAVLGRDWQGDKAADVFDAKGDVLALLAALGVPTGGLKLTPGGRAFLHPGRSATLSFGPKTVIGWFGELHPRTLEALGVEGPIVAFEIILDGLPPPKARPTRVKPKLALADLQPVRRDFAFIVDEAVPAETLLQAARTADRALITEVALFDVYAGKGVEPGKRSLAVAVTLQPREATLTDAEIEAVGAAIVASVQKVTGAVLRG